MMGWMAVFFLAFSVFFLLIINYLANEAAVSSANLQLLNQVRRMDHVAGYKDGVVTFPKDYAPENENVEYACLDNEGRLLFGECPEEILHAGTIEHLYRMRDVTSDGKRYFVLNRRKYLHGKDDVESFVVRVWIKRSVAFEPYTKLRRYCLISFFFGIALLVFVSITMRQMVSQPLREMCEQADGITADMDFSSRVEYEGEFLEIDKLIHTYNHLLERTQRILERQEQFNSDVSHELRTPIAIINAQAELSKERATKFQDEDLRESFAVIERQAKRMNSMVEQLLNLSRFDRNSVEFDLEEFDLVDIIEVICEDEARIADGKYYFENDLHPAVTQVDVHLMMIAIRNLVSNAIKYSPEGSKIEVSCGKTEEGVFVHVKDHGRGIPKEEQQKVFEHYYREETSRHSEGFGLGLTLASKIVQKHGGRIRLESEEGKGSEFTIELQN